jgi:outer membrane murein-binding lipoprotein Lpp
MSDAPTTQAEQEDAVREALITALNQAFRGFSFPGGRWSTGYGAEMAADALLAGPIATLRAKNDQLAAKLEEAEEEVDIVRQDSSQQMQMLDRIAKRLGLAHDEGLEDAEPFLAAIDQLAADLRKATVQISDLA